MCAFLKGPRKRRKEGIIYWCPDGTKPCKANQNLPNIIATPAIGDHLEKGKTLSSSQSLGFWDISPKTLIKIING